MNPLTNIKNVQKLNETELQLGIIGKKSWHDEYKDSAWIFIGGLPYDLSEGDVICVFSQYGEVVNMNLVRDHKTGKSKGYGFLCFEDQRSTVLSVDNLNGIKILGRTVRVDHVKEYRVPKEHKDDDELTLKMREEGCAPKILTSEEETQDTKKETLEKTERIAKKEKKKKKKSKRKRKDSDSSSSLSPANSNDDHVEASIQAKIKLEVKKEKEDRGYEKAARLSGTTSNLTRDRDEHHRSLERNERGAREGNDQRYSRGKIGRNIRDSERHREPTSSKQKHPEWDEGEKSHHSRDINREEKNRDKRDPSDRQKYYEYPVKDFKDRGSDRFKDRSRDRERYGERSRNKDNFRERSRDRDLNRYHDRAREESRRRERS